MNSDFMPQHTIMKYLHYWRYLLCIFAFLSWRFQLGRNVNEPKNKELEDRKLAYSPTWSQVSTLSFRLYLCIYVCVEGVGKHHEIVLVSWILDTLHLCVNPKVLLYFLSFFSFANINRITAIHNLNQIPHLD